MIWMLFLVLGPGGQVLAVPMISESECRRTQSEVEAKRPDALVICGATAAPKAGRI